MNVQQRLRPRRSCRCATSRGGPSAVDGGGRQRWDPRDPRLTDMRWSSVTGRPFTRLQKASVCVDPSEIARSDANLTQVTGVAGEERPADSRGARRHGSLSEQTSVRALSRTDADDQGDFRYSTSSRCSPRLRPASSTLSTSVTTEGAMSARSSPRPCRRCSKLCSQRDDKRQLGTGWDRIAFATFSAGNARLGRFARG